MDGPEEAEAVGPCGAPRSDGARARTFVALVAAVARDRGRRVVMVAVLREEEEELWCRAPPAIILATAALPYVPGCGGGTCGCWARRANDLEAAGEEYAPQCEIGCHQPLGRALGHGPAAAEKLPPFVAMGAEDDSHHELRVPHQPAEGEREAGGEADDSGAVVVEVHGGDGAQTVWQIANGGWTAPWRVVVIFVVGDVNRGVCPLGWQRPCWCAPGGAGRRCCRVLVGEDFQPLNVGAVSPRAIVPDILLDQGAQCVECEVFGLFFGAAAELRRVDAVVGKAGMTRSS